MIQLTAQIKISPEQIEFDHFYYSVIIPKNSDIRYYMPTEISSTIGIPPFMAIDSNRYIFKSFLGSAMGKIFYFLRKYVHSGRYNYPPNMVSSLANIEKVLLQLEQYGYNVAQAKAEFLKIKNTSPDPKTVSGTKEWRGDKRNLMLIVAGFMFLILIPLLREYLSGKMSPIDARALLILIVMWSLITLVVGLVAIFWPGYKKNKQ